MLVILLREDGDALEIEVQPEDNVHEKVMEELGHIKCTISFAEDILGPEDTFGDFGIEGGARLQISKPLGHVPRDGLRLWLTAKKGVEKEADDSVLAWTNPDFEEGLGLVAAPEEAPVAGEEGGLGSYVNFGYNHWGFIQKSDPENPASSIGWKDASLDTCVDDAPGLRHTGHPQPVKTIISCHQYTAQDVTGADAVSSQFYIFTGDCQGPLHGDGPLLSEKGISSGHGRWAGGDNFHKGSIRLDGSPPKPVADTKAWEFVTPRIAVVEMSRETGGDYWHGEGVYGIRGPGMNRIGRDRDCHAFTGRLYEVLVYDRHLEPEEILAVEAHMFAEWPGVATVEPPSSLRDAAERIRMVQPAFFEPEDSEDDY